MAQKILEIVAKTNKAHHALPSELIFVEQSEEQNTNRMAEEIC